MSYEINTELYEGPMELLLELVNKKKLDIYDISINKITSQYIEYISDLKKMDMEIASEFIFMATRLLEIKSRYMLFIAFEDEGEDPRKELFDNIKEYSVYKNAAQILKENYKNALPDFVRPLPEIYMEEKVDFEKIQLEDLLISHPKKSAGKEDEGAADFSRKVISVDEKINEIKNLLIKKPGFFLDEFTSLKLKDDKIASVLGVLELAKERHISIFQEEHLERIYVERWKEIEI